MSFIRSRLADALLSVTSTNAVTGALASGTSSTTLGIGVSRWNAKGSVNYNPGVSTAGGNSTIVSAWR